MNALYDKNGFDWLNFRLHFNNDILPVLERNVPLIAIRKMKDLDWAEAWVKAENTNLRYPDEIIFLLQRLVVNNAAELAAFCDPTKLYDRDYLVEAYNWCCSRLIRDNGGLCKETSQYLMDKIYEFDNEIQCSEDIEF